MDFIGIDPLELLLVLIIGFLLLGPEKLPEMAAKAGHLFRNLRKATGDLSGAIITPTSDHINQSLVAVPTIFLYELGVPLSKLAR